MGRDTNTGIDFELDPDLARLSAQQQSAAQQFQELPTPITGFVASINNQTGDTDIVGGVYDGVTYTFTGGAGQVTLTVTGIKELATVKVRTTNTAPTVTDDAAHGYSKYSEWIDTTGPDFYVCVSATTGAAVWLKLN